MTEVAKPERQAEGQRDQRYGEVLGIFAEGDQLFAHVYGTQMLNDCPQELWEGLDVPAITSQLGALFVKLNGPRHWVIDALGGPAEEVDRPMASFCGLEMRRLAVLDLGTNPLAEPYNVRYVDRKAIFFFDAGKPVFELVDPDGTAYVMQAYCIGVDASLTMDSLEALGERLQLPEGWSYRSRILEEELVVDTSANLAAVLQDELENTYTLAG